MDYSFKTCSPKAATTSHSTTFSSICVSTYPYIMPLRRRRLRCIQLPLRHQTTQRQYLTINSNNQKQRQLSPYLTLLVQLNYNQTELLWSNCCYKNAIRAQPRINKPFHREKEHFGLLTMQLWLSKNQFRLTITSVHNKLVSSKNHQLTNARTHQLKKSSTHRPTNTLT